MATNIVALTTGPGTSVDQTVTNGTPVRYSLVSATPGWNNGARNEVINGFLDIKGSNGTYTNIDKLTNVKPYVDVLVGGVYRLRTVVTATPVGIDASP